MASKMLGIAFIVLSIIVLVPVLLFTLLAFGFMIGEPFLSTGTVPTFQELIYALGQMLPGLFVLAITILMLRFSSKVFKGKEVHRRKTLGVLATIGAILASITIPSSIAFTDSPVLNLSFLAGTLSLVLFLLLYAFYKLQTSRA